MVEKEDVEATPAAVGDGAVARALRNALGCYATGVTIIATLGRKGEPVGFTANSFSSVSLDPPLVLFSLGRRANSLRAFLSNHHFTVNVLAEHQGELSSRFAQALADKWQGVAWTAGIHGCPVIAGAAAVFQARVHHTYHGGDHVIIVGAVEAYDADPSARPLLFHRGRYASLSPKGEDGTPRV
jgi:3-hydroxy-9,10-secoandrosta-1,3,5(10)-triene-9,17-dione monooxygenase reductase component